MRQQTVHVVHGILTIYIEFSHINIDDAWDVPNCHQTFLNNLFIDRARYRHINKYYYYIIVLSLKIKISIELK